MPTIQRFERALAARGLPLGPAHAPEGPPPTREATAAYFANALPALREAIGFAELAELLATTACGLTGARDKACRALGKQTAALPLPQRIAALQKVKGIYPPVLNKEGTLLTLVLHCAVDVRLPTYGCACGAVAEKGKPAGLLPAEYCLCCAGQFRHHFQNALGVQLTVDRLVSTPLGSGGLHPFIVQYRITPH